MHGALVDIAFAAGELDLLVVQDEAAVVHGTVGQNFEVGVGAFHGAQIAAVFFDLILQSGPGGKVVGHANLFDGGQIDHVQIKVLATCSGPAST